MLHGSRAANKDIKRSDYLISVGDRLFPQGARAKRLNAILLRPLMTGKVTQIINANKAAGKPLLP